MRTGEFFCHGEKLVVGNFIPNDYAEFRPIIEVKGFDQVNSHIICVCHTDHVVPISWDRRRATGYINTKGERLQVSLDMGHSPVVHKETRDYPGILQGTSLETICRIKPVLNAGVNRK
jgi:hypothetical protein